MKNFGDGFAFGVEEILFIDILQIASPLQKLVGAFLELMKIKLSARRAAQACLSSQHLGAGNVDKADGACHDEQMLLSTTVLGDDSKALGHIVDRAEEQRPVDAHHLELWALWQARIGAEALLGQSRVGDPHTHPWTRRAMQIDDQREEYAQHDGEIQLEEQGPQEGPPQHHGIGTAGTHDLLDVCEIDDTERDQEQDAGHRRIRQVGEQWRH